MLRSQVVLQRWQRERYDMRVLVYIASLTFFFYSEPASGFLLQERNHNDEEVIVRHGRIWDDFSDGDYTLFRSIASRSGYVIQSGRTYIATIGEGKPLQCISRSEIVVCTLKGPLKILLHTDTNIEEYHELSNVEEGICFAGASRAFCENE
jgi:hypothetical protein